MIYHISDFLGSRSTSYALCEAVNSLCDGDTLCLDGKELEIDNSFASGEFFYLPRYSNLKKYYAVNIKKKRDITIDGGGANLIFKGDVSAFGLEECENITLKNFTIDYKTPCFIQGRIIEAEENYIVLDFNSEGLSVKYDADERKLLFKPFGSEDYYEADSFLTDEFEPDTKFRAASSPDYFLCVNKEHPFYPSMSVLTDVEVLGDGRMKFTFKNKKISHKVGNCLVGTVHERRNNNIHLFRCKNVTLENITMYSSLSFGVINLCGENMTVRNVNSLLKPNTQRLIAVVADMFHCVNMRGSVGVYDCTVENLMDDCLNIHSLLSVVKECVSTDTLLIHFTYLAKKAINLYTAGEKISVLHPDTFEKIGTFTVKSSEYMGDYHLKVQFSENVSDIPEGFILESEDAKPSVHISDCRMGRNRGRGLLVPCGGKTLIENNEIYSSSNGILASGASKTYLEGSAITDLTIKNNDLTRCNPTDRGADIRIDPTGLSEISSTYHNNIKIFGNRFGTNKHKAVYMRACGNVEIYDNFHYDGKEIDSSETELYTFSGCTDIKIR